MNIKKDALHKQFLNDIRNYERNLDVGLKNTDKHLHCLYLANYAGWITYPDNDIKGAIEKFYSKFNNLPTVICGILKDNLEDDMPFKIQECYPTLKPAQIVPIHGYGIELSNGVLNYV